MKGLSFKKEPHESGLSNTAPDTVIKLDGIWCGNIYAPSRFHMFWRVSLAAADPMSKAGFRWVNFAKNFTSEPEAREWLKERWDTITSVYTIFKLD